MDIWREPSKIWVQIPAEFVSFKQQGWNFLVSLTGADFVKPALYSSTDVANLYLAKGSAKSLHDMIIYQSQTIYPLWSNMVDAIRSVGDS